MMYERKTPFLFQVREYYKGEKYPYYVCCNIETAGEDKWCPVYNDYNNYDYGLTGDDRAKIEEKRLRPMAEKMGLEKVCDDPLTYREPPRSTFYTVIKHKQFELFGIHSRYENEAAWRPYDCCIDAFGWRNTKEEAEEDLKKFISLCPEMQAELVPEKREKFLL